MQGIDVDSLSDIQAITMAMGGMTVKEIQEMKSDERHTFACECRESLRQGQVSAAA